MARREVNSEPDPLGPLRPIARRWWLVLIMAVIGVAAGYAVADRRAPVYTATSEINVGRVDVRVQALPGYVAGAESLASAYSRIVESNQILEPVGRQLGISTLEVASRVTASPVPSSPIFRISGAGASPQDAIRVTNAATNQIRHYVSRTSTGQNAVSSLLSRYQKQIAESQALSRRIGRMQTRRTLSIPPIPTTADISKIKVEQSTAQLRANSLATQYETRDSELSSTAGVQVLSRPFSAKSDRKSLLQRGIAAGLVGGLAIGALLAVFTDALSRRRRLRRASA